MGFIMDGMGDPNGQLLAMSVMMRYADIDASRDLDRPASRWPAAGDPESTAGASSARTSLDTRPAA